MTDDLIKRVALKLGWQYYPTDPWPWQEPNSPYRNTDEGLTALLAAHLTSVDTALSLLGKEVRLEILWDIMRQEYRLQYGNGEVQIAKSLELLPVAICEAFLAVEKP